MITQLANRGFGHGTGLLSPDCSKFIVNMPKNASSFVLDWGSHNGWTQAAVGDQCAWHKVKQVIVILRDPVDRWVSGVAQYINSYILSNCGPNGPYYQPNQYTRYISATEFVAQYNDIVDRLLFDNAVWLDDHVWPQHAIFENVLPDIDRKYFMVGTTLEKDLSEALGWQPVNDLDRNRGADNPDIKKLQEFFANRLNNRPDLAQRIKKFYQQDYNLIKEVFNARTR